MKDIVIEDKVTKEKIDEFIRMEDLVKRMEEMAGMPRESFTRQPGEKCSYEIQRILNEDSRSR